MSRLRDNSKLVKLVHKVRVQTIDLMTAELGLKLIAEPVTHFAVKRRGKRWVNPLYNL